MGKNWKGKNKYIHGHGKGGGGGGNDLPSCRGMGIVVGSCDNAREREASKELVNLFNEHIEELLHNNNSDTSNIHNDDDSDID